LSGPRLPLDTRLYLDEEQAGEIVGLSGSIIRAEASE